MILMATVIGNDRPGHCLISPLTQSVIGFSDAGAHLRGMAHYDSRYDS